MKVKKIFVAHAKKLADDKIVLVQEVPFLKKTARLYLEDYSFEYNCVFTGTKFWFKPVNVTPLSFFMNTDQLSKNITTKELKIFLKDNEESMKEHFRISNKQRIGF